MITRDNYEEFFLLYTDNELSAAEKQEVERFVTDHPDLREEWEALLQCRLSPDTHLAFPDREALLKPGNEALPALYYIDGLPFLHPDNSVVFPDKDRLYRTAKDRRIIPPPWLRAGIAAAVVGAIALAFLLTARQQSGQLVQRATARTIPRKNVTPAVTPMPAPALHIVEDQPKPKQRRPVRKSIPSQPDQQQDLAVNSNPDAGPTPARSAIDPRKEMDPRKQMDPRKEMDPPASTVSALELPVTDHPEAAADVHLAVQTGIPKDQSSFATQALLEEQSGEQRTIPGDQRTALRGLLRKVKRAFAKTADRDNDGNRQVLVGAFEVSLD
ncbi:MAG TPA: hypothetical protein VL978_12645 [Puia sp.]|nr:hypothetical protein [Puia sp.]